jgi:F0F1-type ATP synthase assembly protein I
MHNPKKQVASYLRFSAVAFQMGAIIGLMTWLGVWLDDQYNPTGAAFTVVCALTGVAAGLYLVIKEVIKNSQ